MVALALVGGLPILANCTGAPTRAPEPTTSGLTDFGSLTASASSNVTYGTVPLSVQFSGTPSGGTPPYTYLWTFGDGTNSTMENPTHVYAERGVYYAQFNVTDAVGTRNQSGVTIYASGASPTSLAVNLTASPTSGPAPLWVTFSVTVNGCEGLCEFTLLASNGTGSESLGSDPGGWVSSGETDVVDASMADPGIWTVTAMAMDQLNDTGSDNVTIQVASGGGPLSVILSASPPNGTAPLVVSFWGNISGGLAPYEEVWQFGDGGNGTGAYVLHTYSHPGTYLAEVTVVSSNGLRTNRSMGIDVSNGTGASTALALQISEISPSVPSQNLTFEASAAGGAPPYALTVSTRGENETITIRDWNGSRTWLSMYFPEPGSYSVTAMATDSAGVQSVATTGAIVQEIAPLRATVRASVETGSAPWTVTWTAALSGGVAPFSIQWAFGDGSYGSSEQGGPVAHTYVAAGNYRPTLLVTDAAGQQVNLTLPNVTVNPASGLGPGELPLPGTRGLDGGALLLLPIAAAGAALAYLSGRLARQRRYRREGEELVRELRARSDELHGSAGAPPAV